MTAIFIALTALFGLLAVEMFLRHRRLRLRIKDISTTLEDIENGNSRRRLLADPGEDTADICFQMNHIVSQCNEKINLLEQQEKAHKQLLTALSHDVRTPLTSLIGYLEAVDENYIEDEQKPEYISAAKHKAHDLKTFTDMLFDLFKLDSQEMRFSFDSQDIYELTRVVIADFIPTIEKSGMQYKILISEGELYCPLDTEAYKRMLGNLLQNALTHSGGSMIEISANCSGESAVISVCDNGAGIDKRDFPYIFDRLYQCDVSRTAKGSGLGLSITSALAKAHGGAVEVSATPGGGCTFTLHLPLLNS